MSSSSSPPIGKSYSSNEPWDCILPGPPSRSNFGAADLNPAGLLAFASGGSVSVVDSRSLQLISTIPVPSPASSAIPYPSMVTSVRWAPIAVRPDILSSTPSPSHLLLAVGDRLGRIALVDFRIRSVVLWFQQSVNSSNGKLRRGDGGGGGGGVQDLCWALARPEYYVLAAISGPSSLSLYTDSGQIFWKYDASPEFLSCIRCDPFDFHHFCVVGLKGFLLSVKVLGNTENDIALKEFQIQTDQSELLKLERDSAISSSNSSPPLQSSPASAAFPFYFARFAFSPHWRHILFVTLPRELFVFDLHYEAVLCGLALPRGFPKFVDVLADPKQELLYCIHLDGKLSIWRRKE